MANYTTPDTAVLDKETLKAFYAMTSSPNDPNNFTYTPGHERFLENWYRPSVGGEYTLLGYVADLVSVASTYPQVLAIGGNVNGVNTYAPLNISDLTYGVYNTATLLEGDNLACFVFQTAQLLQLDALSNIEGAVAGLLGELNSAIGGLLNKLTCPQLQGINSVLFTRYPGYVRSQNGQ